MLNLKKSAKMKALVCNAKKTSAKKCANVAFKSSQLISDIGIIIFDDVDMLNKYLFSGRHKILANFNS